MRTIHVYKVWHDTWLSPGELWQAITSKEDVVVMAHSIGVNIPKALIVAAKHLRFVWKTAALAAFGGGLWSLLIAALATWPIIGALMISEIQVTFQFAGVLGAVVCGGMVVYSIHGWYQLRHMLFDFPIAIGQKLPAPVAALRQPKYRLPKLRLPVVLVVMVIVLNSIVVASPLTPAVVWPGAGEPYVTNAITMVVPFTQWEQREQYPPGSSVARFVTVSDGEKFWVVEMEYYVYRADILEELDDWDTWLDNALYYLIDQDVRQLRLGLDADFTDEQQTEALVEIVSDPERLNQLGSVLVQFFTTRYPTLALRGVHLEVKLMTMAQLRSALGL